LILFTIPQHVDTRKIFVSSKEYFLLTKDQKQQGFANAEATNTQKYH